MLILWHHNERWYARRAREGKKSYDSCIHIYIKKGEQKLNLTYAFNISFDSCVCVARMAARLSSCASLLERERS